MVRDRKDSAAKKEYSSSGEFGEAVKRLRKTHGDSVITDLQETFFFKEVTPCGIAPLDYSFFGGFPEGKIAMLYGYESSGKTTLALRLAASIQKKHKDKVVVWVDAEGALDRLWAEFHGVDLDRFFIPQPSCGEEAVDMVHEFMQAKEVAAVFLDSIPALVPTKMLESSAEDDFVAVQARMITRMMSKCVTIQNNEKRRGHTISLYLINQFRNKIGVVYGDTRTLPGGNAIKYFVRFMVELKCKPMAVKDSDGQEIVAYNKHSFVVKKASGNTINSGEFVMIRDPNNEQGFPVGFIDDAPFLINVAKKRGIITGGGTKWCVSGVEHSFGRLSEVQDWLYSDRSNYNYLKQMLIQMRRSEHGMQPLPADGYLG